MGSLAWQQYIGEHLIAFDCGKNLAGYFLNCKVWPAHTGYIIHDTGWVTLMDCMADLAIHPFKLINANKCRIIGGQAVAGTILDGGSNIAWSRTEHIAIFIDGNSYLNAISDVDIISGGSGVFVSSGAFANVISECSFDVGRGPGTSWCGAIWDGGTKPYQLKMS